MCNQSSNRALRAGRVKIRLLQPEHAMRSSGEPEFAVNVLTAAPGERIADKLVADLSQVSHGYEFRPV